MNGQPNDMRPELQQLPRRHGGIGTLMRRPWSVRTTVERELQAIDEKLKRFSAALQALRAIDGSAPEP